MRKLKEQPTLYESKFDSLSYQKPLEGFCKLVVTINGVNSPFSFTQVRAVQISKGRTTTLKIKITFPRILPNPVLNLPAFYVSVGTRGSRQGQHRATMNPHVPRFLLPSVSCGLFPRRHESALSHVIQHM